MKKTTRLKSPKIRLAKSILVHCKEERVKGKKTAVAFVLDSNTNDAWSFQGLEAEVLRILWNEGQRNGLMLEQLQSALEIQDAAPSKALSRCLRKLQEINILTPAELPGIAAAAGRAPAEVAKRRARSKNTVLLGAAIGGFMTGANAGAMCTSVPGFLTTDCTAACNARLPGRGYVSCTGFPGSGVAPACNSSGACYCCSGGVLAFSGGTCSPVPGPSCS